MAPVTGLTSRQQLFAVLAVLALFVRLLAPAGFMPQVACPGVVASASHGHGHNAPGHDGFERPCAFAAVAAAATIMAVAMLLALPLAPRVPRAVRPVAARRVHAALRWRPPLRAPPKTPSIR